MKDFVFQLISEVDKIETFFMNKIMALNQEFSELKSKYKMQVWRADQVSASGMRLTKSCSEESIMKIFSLQRNKTSVFGGSSDFE